MFLVFFVTAIWIIFSKRVIFAFETTYFEKELSTELSGDFQD